MKKTNRVVSQYTYHKFKKEKDISYENFDHEKYPSQTVPSMSMGLKELLERFATGKSITLRPSYWYDEDGLNIDVSKMDKMDIEDLKLKVAAEIKEKEKELAVIRQAKKDKIAAEKEAKLAEKLAKQAPPVQDNPKTETTDRTP